MTMIMNKKTKITMIMTNEKTQTITTTISLFQIGDEVIQMLNQPAKVWVGQ